MFSYHVRSTGTRARGFSNLLRRGEAIVWNARQKGTMAAAANLEPPLGMKDMPQPFQWPLVQGLPDTLMRQRGGVPQTEIFHQYYMEYGNMFSWNLPNRQCVVAYDPVEAVKALQYEGQYPYGGAEEAWPFGHFFRKRFANDSPIVGIISTGEQWKNARKNIAPYLLPPKSAKALLPHITRAARQASSTADHFADNFDDFTNRVAFDMFAGIALGEIFRTASPNDGQELHLNFLHEVLEAFRLVGELLQDPFGKLRSGKIAEFERHMGKSFDYAEEVVVEVIESMNAGNVNEYNNSSFMSKLLADGQGLEDVKAAVMALLQAGVDTTGYIVCWLFLNLAMYPDKQQILREELQQVLKGRDLDEDSLKKLPYLKAFISECNRLTPPFALTIGKKALTDLEIGGYTVPAGTMISCGYTGIQWDPKYVDSPREFIPERYLADAVAKRKGTFKEKIDHKLLAAPFSAGARMCIGGRVAELEMMALAARIVQDWHLALKPNQTWKVRQFLMLKADPFPKFEMWRVSA